MSGRVRWGIWGAGSIAHKFMEGVAASETAEVVAVMRRDAGKARAFAEQHGIAASYDNAEALLNDQRVEAIYIATPHPMHARAAIQCAEHGKHILCEKPAAINRHEMSAVLSACRRHNVFFMEAFKDRVHPVFLELFDRIRSGAIGKVTHIDAAFGFKGHFDSNSRLFDKSKGGGGILDVGCYAVAFARAIAGIANGKGFADPVALRGVGVLGESGVDEHASAVMRFEGDVVAQVTTSLRINHSVVRVFGSEGTIHVPGHGWHPEITDGHGSIKLERIGQPVETIRVPVTKHLFSYEIDAAGKAIRAGKREADAPAMTWADSLGQAATLDAWRDQIKLVYPQETPEGYATPLHGRPLARHVDAPMTYGRLPEIDLPVSRMFMGCDNQPDFAQAATLFDAWFEAGGNAFDTAWLYGNGRQEQLLGHWLRTRGVRKQCIILGKGGHSPHCTPEHIRKHIEQSLDRLDVEKLDLYLLHRDNLDLPVGELVDVLHEQAEIGRIGPYGGSNWTTQRLAEANAYARQHNRRPMRFMSNQFSLAHMVNPVWGGCVSCSDEQSVRFLVEQQMANFAWSSQARGYFNTLEATGRLDYHEHQNPFDSEVNRRRRARAFELAKTLGVSAINVAAAYVLHQPFSSFAIIGPRTLHELETTLPALSVKLTPQQIAYLELRSDSPD